MLTQVHRGHVVITGGAGFIGSHLCERFLREGNAVTAIDSFLTGVRSNLEHLQTDPRFRLVPGDVTHPIEITGRVDSVLHFASPASPIDYLANPIHTMKVDSFGAFYTLGLVAYHRVHAVDVRIARIFNTYGPRMRRNDGRAIPAFVDAALSGRVIEVNGDGTQTRSFCYIDDLVEGVFRLATHPGLAGHIINLGHDIECSLLDLAEMVKRLTGSTSPIVFRALPQDDPRRRRPDLTKARRVLGYEPRIPLEDGLRHTIAWFVNHTPQAATTDERVTNAVSI